MANNGRTEDENESEDSLYWIWRWFGSKSYQWLIGYDYNLNDYYQYELLQINKLLWIKGLIMCKKT
jgi:hypothetical protein